MLYMGDVGIGTTDRVFGLFEVIWMLQRLARWGEEVFWPWYKKNALGIA